MTTASLSLHDHPRLLASATQLARLRETTATPLLRRAEQVVIAEARRYAENRELQYDPNLHNALLNRAREMQRRVITLLVRWVQTGDDLYRSAALAHVRDMGAWSYWSWGMEINKNTDPHGDFDLSYGENSATLALAYDWLHATLSEEERAMFLEIAVRWSLRPFLSRTEPDIRASASWWFGSPVSNWNTVCAGGAGMVALAMMDELPEAAEVIKRAEVSIAPYMESMQETAGGWIEGIGYWGYGHRYAFWYLLSHESATGKPHPLLQLSGVAQTLEFPLNFCPHGQPCSFSDVNTWSPLPFHYAAAERLKRTDLIGQLDRAFYIGRSGTNLGWPGEAELLLFHPRKAPRARAVKGPIQKLYPKLNWGILADRLPDPNFYLSVRGGEAGWETPHSQMDLLSFHCVVGKERLIDNIGVLGGKEYLDTTFSRRRYELFEMSAPSKNTILINGVGIRDHSIISTTRPAEEGWKAWGSHFYHPHSCSVATTGLAGKGWKGFRLDATQAMNAPGDNSVRFCGRLFLFLDGPCAVILDRVEISGPGRVESRLHTYSRVKFDGDHAEIRGQQEKLVLAFAASVPSALYRAEDALTNSGKRSTMLRWCTRERIHREVTFATLLAPGRTAGQVVLEESPSHVLVQIRHRGKSRRFKISKDLLKVT